MSATNSKYNDLVIVDNEPMAKENHPISALSLGIIFNSVDSTNCMRKQNSDQNKNTIEKTKQLSHKTSEQKMSKDEKSVIMSYFDQDKLKLKLIIQLTGRMI